MDKTEQSPTTSTAKMTEQSKYLQAVDLKFLTTDPTVALQTAINDICCTNNCTGIIHYSY